MKLTRNNPFTGKSITREVGCTEEQYQRWRNGEGVIQDIMPDVSADDREFIMTGITPEQWDDLFKEKGE